MKNLIGNKKIIVIGTGKQGEKVIQFLISQGCKENLIGVCKTKTTQKKIQEKYSIPVMNEYQKTIHENLENIGFIFIGVKPEQKQEEVYINIITQYPQVKILIEKSFISNSALQKIGNHKNTSIVISEQHSLPFFQILISNTPEKSISSISMVLKIDTILFNLIQKGEVFLLSYIFDYISFLQLREIRLDSLEKKSEKTYNLTFYTETGIYIIISLQHSSTTTKNTSNTVMYKMKDGSTHAFNNKSTHSILQGKKINNYPENSKNHFEFFLKESIQELLLGTNNSDKDIETVLKFRELNKINSLLQLK